MFQKLLSDRNGEVLGVVKHECLVLRMTGGGWHGGGVCIDHRGHHHGVRAAPEGVLAEHEVGQRRWQAGRLLYDHAASHLQDNSIINSTADLNDLIM